MNAFNDLGIKAPEHKMMGEKIKIDKILNKPIVVYDYEIKPSKFAERGNGKCLYMQVEVDNVKRVVFIGSTVLQEMISQVPKEKFPFTTKIVKENDRLEFT